MQVHLDVADDLRAGFAGAGLVEAGPGHPTVISVPESLSGWPATLEALTGVFATAKAAAVAEVPVVFVVSSEALLGRTGPEDAMAANGVVSGARTLAAELGKRGVPVNCLARSPESPVGDVVTWTRHLLGGGSAGPTGVVVNLGGVQIGKALT